MPYHDSKSSMSSDEKLILQALAEENNRNRFVPIKEVQFYKNLYTHKLDLERLRSKKSLLDKNSKLDLLKRCFKRSASASLSR